MKFVPKELVHTADASRGRETLRTRLQFAITVVLVLGGLYLTLGLVGETAGRFLPDSWERQFAAVPVPGLTDAPVLDPARDVLVRLMQDESLRELDYQLLLLDDSAPNAFAVIGGTIGVTQGLLDMVESEEGLAFVLAHELGHHQNRDNPRRMGRRLLFGLVVGMFSGQATTSVVNGSLEMVESGHSRSQELAADLYALELVRRKFDDTERMLEFFHKMFERREEARWERYFLSHPLTQERIERLEARMETRIEARMEPRIESSP